MRVQANDLAIEFELNPEEPSEGWDLALLGIGPFQLLQGDHTLYEGKTELANFASFAYCWAVGIGRKEFRYDDEMQGYIACPLLLKLDEDGRYHFDWELDKAEGYDFERFPENEVDETDVRRLFLAFACTLRRLMFERWQVDIGPWLTGKFKLEDKLRKCTKLEIVPGCS